ncbi:RHS repeat domain-containing protein [Catellatospora tritici]|uniref:RHS repeat domain-containing protein n=1 Tax=Catellatospora tritici TaxID=2851566 RepID=UPI0020C4CCF5|nr:RHS repeat-associated core domain-containing protein [Catellatospora tritici]
MTAPPAPDAGPRVAQVTEVAPRFPGPKPDRAAGNYQPAKPRFPEASSESVTLAPSTGGQQLGTKTRGAHTPVWLQSHAVRDWGATSPTEVAIAIADQVKTRAAGVSGVVFSVSTKAAGGAAMRVGLDYSAFAEAYGGNYASRLRLVRLPACALTTPQVAACRTGQPLRSSRNDLVGRSVSADVDLVGSERTMVLAVTSSDPGTDGGSGGTYAATELKPSGTWNAGGSNGSFTYSYPLTVPPAQSALMAEMALNYDSGGIDGQTASTQAQASWVGEGWSTPTSYIEQSFTPCSDKPEGVDSPVKTSDMCYNGKIMSLSLNGSSAALVWDATASVWKPEKDDGSVIAHVTNSNNGSGTYNTDYWTVTSRNGTVYYFGRNKLPGWTSGKALTNSTDSEPVYSPHSGGPCYNSSGFSSSWCTMAYKWNLDYVVDVHGNAMSYYYQQYTNFYGRNKGATMTSYVRNSHLDHIDYGFTDGNAYGTVPNRVKFNTAERCLVGTCSPLSSSNKANWPDVPFDLVCASGATCNSQGPAFFSTVRLTSVVTQQYSTTTSDYQPVDTYALAQTIPPTGDGTSPTLWLASITRTGHDTSAGATGAVTAPPIQFGSIQLQNRVDTVTDGLPAFYKYRIQSVTSETGSVTTVSYGLPNPCTAPVTINAATNTSSCYPVSWTPAGYTDPIKDWFHKYAVTKVTATDPTGGAPSLSTSYSYLGGAAWHFDDNELVKAKDRTYGQFRGYGRVQTRNGDGVNDRQTLSETTYYRGMSKNNNTTVVNVTDSQGGVHEDHDELAGKTLETTSYLGDGGAVDSSSISSYWVSGASATRSRTGLPALTAKRVATVLEYTRQAVTGPGATTWRTSATTTSYDDSTASATFGVTKAVYSYSIPVNAAFDKCTVHTYAPVNTAKNLVGLSAESETTGAACGGFALGANPTVPGSLNTLTAPTSVSRPSQVISSTRTYYDDPAWSLTFPQTSVSKGDVTMERKAVTYTAGAYEWQTTKRSAYDTVGRMTDEYDGNGNRTTYGFTVNSVGLVTAKSVGKPLSHTATSTLSPLRGLTLTATDINNVVTTQRYDALGRLTGVWLNNRTTTTPANFKFTYQVLNNGLSATTSQQLNDSSGYITSTLIYDALLRTRQTQKMTPQGGRLVEDTYYDSRGWVRRKDNGWWDPNTTPAMSLIAPTAVTPPPQLPNQTAFTYDGLGRVVYEDVEKNNTFVSRTVTVYNGDRTTIIPPVGGTVQQSVTDALGRQIAMSRYSVRPTLNIPFDVFTDKFSVNGGTAYTVDYGFDAQGNQSSITAPGPRTWTFNYNLLGQVTSKTDPDGGATTGILYDGNGNIKQSTNSLTKTVSTVYDALNRKIAAHTSTVAQQSSSNKIASWVYDNSDGAIANMSYAKGKQTSSTAYWGGNAYTVQQNNFNIFGQSTGATTTIPSVEGGLAGTYTFSQVFTTTTGLPFKDIYPAQGGLPAETVLHGYSGVLDKPNTLGGLVGYGQGVTYDAWGRVSQSLIGTGTNQAAITSTWDPTTGWLKQQLVTRTATTPSTVDQQDYYYDLGGNVQRQKSTRLGSTTLIEDQCSRYDELKQLVAAWTATDDCAVQPTEGSSAMVGDGLGASSAYWTTWTADPLGWQQQVKHSTTGGTATTVDFTYNGNGAGQPHTLTGTTKSGASTGSTTYTYDAAGNMLTRNAGQGSQSFTWDDAGRLTAVTGGTGGPSTFLYDADGSLLLQKDPGKTTLYFGTQQITLNTGTNTQSGVRYYPLPGGGKAVRTGTATTAYSYVISDRHGTPALYLDNTAQVPTWRQTTPYGADRGPASTAPDNRAFLDKPKNLNTGLTQVGARQYDPEVGRFISVDPKLTTDDPQQLNAYGYGANNPNSNADPTGERVDDDGGSIPNWIPDRNGRLYPNPAAPRPAPSGHGNAHSNPRRHVLYQIMDGDDVPGNLVKTGITGNLANMPPPGYTGPWDPTGRYTPADMAAYGDNAQMIIRAEGSPRGSVQAWETAIHEIDPGPEDHTAAANRGRNGLAQANADALAAARAAPGGLIDEAADVSRLVGGSGASRMLATGGAVAALGTVAKYAGPVGDVIDIGIGVYDVINAPPGEKVRTAVREGTSIACGIAFGAVGAAVAGPVGAVVLGYVGSVVGAKLGDAMSDLFHW